MAKRGISASRTIDKLALWLWLLGRDDLSEMVSKSEDFAPYGVPALLKLAEAIGIEAPKDLKEFSSYFEEL